jgi:hypothetical protein
LQLDSDPMQWYQVEQHGDIPEPRHDQSSYSLQSLCSTTLIITPFYHFKLYSYYHSILSSQPHPHNYHSLTYDRMLIGDKLWVYGGAGGFDLKHDKLIHYNSIHEFDIATHTWTKIKTFGQHPPPSESQAGIYHKGCM